MKFRSLQDVPSEMFYHSSSGWIDSRSEVQPPVLAFRRPVIHNPLVDDCVQLQQSSFPDFCSLFSTSCLALQYLDEETHTYLQICNLPPSVAWHLREDANNRITVSCVCLSDSFFTKADLVYLMDSCLSGLFLFMHRFPSLLCDRGPGEGELRRSHLPSLCLFYQSHA